jgi:hypothetical protein
MIFKIFSPKKIAKKLAFLTQNKAKLCNTLIVTFVFEKNANFLAENWQKIAENCDHNMVTRLGKFSPIGRLFTLGCYLKITEAAKTIWLHFFHGTIYLFILTQNGAGYILGDAYSNSSGHPAQDPEPELLSFMYVVRTVCA